MTNPVLLPGESHRSNFIVPPDSPLAGAFTQLIAVEEVCLAGDRYENLVDGLMFFLTTRGRARWEIGGVKGEHQPGSLVGITAHQRLTEQIENEGDWSVSYFLLKGAWAESVNNHLLRPERRTVGAWSEPVSPRQRELFASLLELFAAQTNGWEWLFLSRCAELFSGFSLQSSAAKTLSHRLHELLSESPTARLTPAELARLVGLTPRQLLYQIRQETGEPLATWTRKRRIEKACLLLRAEHRVSAVAEQLGFANPYHFSRQFQSVMGLAPSAYQANYGAGLRPLRRRQPERPPPPTPPPSERERGAI